jgi:outer membrane lipoprotein-sorting protein
MRRSPMKGRPSHVVVIIVIMTILGGTQGITQAIPSGSEIMTKVGQRPQPDDMKGELRMILETARGAKRVRSVIQYIGRFGTVEKRILFVTSPAAIRGTSFMNWSHADPNRSGEQWIYLPALGQARRISAKKKSDSFMGSDFSFEDLVERHPDRDSHRVVGTEPLDGRLCYIVESIPNASDSRYGRTLTWVADGIWIGLRKEFYDSDDTLLKVLQVNEHSQIDSFWVITSMTMTNAETEHSTTMELSELSLNSGLAEKDFTLESMVSGIQ